MNDEYRSERRQRLAGLAAIAATAVALVLLLPTATGPAAATNHTNISDVAPYYDNTTANISAGYWFENVTNASLTSIFDMATRLGPVVIGTGEQDPSGTGFVGVLLTGAVISGGALVSLMGVGIGPVGGTIIGMVVAYGLSGVGLAPAWLQPLLVFGIGIGAAVAALRISRA